MLKHSICKVPYRPDKNYKYAYKWQTSLKKLSKDIVEKVWMGCVISGQHRVDANWLFSDWCVLDFDGEVSIRDATDNIFCDMQHIIATTKSHGEKGDRFRVAIPWERRVDDSALYYGNMDYLTRHYEADSQCKNLTRLYYPCLEIISINYDGYRMGVDGRRKIEPIRWNGEHEIISRFALCVLEKKTILQGERDTTIFRLAKDLIKTGYTDPELIETIEELDIRPAFDRMRILTKIRAAHNSLNREVGRND